MVELELPYPPSVNHYWRMGQGHMHISTEGRRYKAIVAGLVRHANLQPLLGAVSLEIELYPPDRRRRDADNALKSVADSLGGAGLYQDDSQIKHIEVWMCEPIPGGKAVIRVEPYDPERHGPAATLVSSN